jgi:hypothetical protein
MLSRTEAITTPGKSRAAVEALANKNKQTKSRRYHYTKPRIWGPETIIVAG